jgi:hypothetical protein
MDRRTAVSWHVKYNMDASSPLALVRLACCLSNAVQVDGTWNVCHRHVQVHAAAAFHARDSESESVFGVLGLSTRRG